MKSMNELAQEVFKNAQLKGWYDNHGGTNMGERIALIHSEASEMLEADREDRYCKSNINAVNGWHYPEEFQKAYVDNVKGTFEEELADIVIRCLDMAAFKGIDIESHVAAKMRYNTLRPIKHGGKKY